MDRSAVRRRRRFPLSLLVVVLAAVALGAILRFVVVPNFRPSLYTAERYGVDVSSAQGDIDWERVRSDGLSFAYIKATEGAGFVDPLLADNVDGAVSVDLSTGLYHAFTLCTPADEQAANLLAALADLSIDPGQLTLPIAVDLKLRGDCSSWPARAELDAELQRFFEAVGPIAGDTFVLQVDDSFDERYEPSARFGYPYWRRSLFRRPADSFAVWQVNGSARVDGIDGDVHLNVARENLVRSPE